MSILKISEATKSGVTFNYCIGENYYYFTYNGKTLLQDTKYIYGKGKTQTIKDLFAATRKIECIEKIESLGLN